jgi:signal transduction histidine kinase
MTSLQTRMIVSYLVVILIGMGIAAPLAWLTVERAYLETQQANLLAQAQLVATTLQTSPQLFRASAPSPPSPYSQSQNMMPGVHTHLIDEQGAVVLDLAPLLTSQVAVQPLPSLAQNAAGNISPQELLDRPEIVKARAGQPAGAIREIAIAGNRRVLYAAAPVLAPDGSVSQIVYLASPLPNSGWGALPEAARWQFAGAIILASALAAAAGWWLALRIARPLRALIDGANIVATGDLERTVPVDTSIADLRALGESFNRMTASLRQADQAKTAFVANVSHELRTPLTIIKGNIETLQDGAVDDLVARESFLTTTANETERLIRLVNDLLVLTRADAGVLNLQLAQVHIGDLAHARARHFAGIAARQRVELCVVEEMPPAAAPERPHGYTTTALADSYRITQVIDNLLDNAIRHSAPGAQITIVVTPGTHEVTCAVADMGVGIPAGQLPLIFDRFYRVDRSRSRDSGGSGLGLSIAHALVLAHGGRMAAESLEGHGTTIRFWLPAAATCH